MTFEQMDRERYPELQVPLKPQRPIKESTETTIDDPEAFTWERVLPLIQEEFRAGKTIVVANGHFVFFHAGHSLLFEEGREVGAASRLDKNPNAVILLAIVNADHQTAIKDPTNAKLETARERALRAYDNRHSDFVVISEAPQGDTTMVTDFQRLVAAGIMGPRLINVKGGDYMHNPAPEAEIVDQYGGRTVALPRHESGVSSSNIVRRMRDAFYTANR